MGTFIEYLIEEADDIKAPIDNNGFKYQSIKSKIFPKLQAVVDVMEEDSVIPNRVEIEFIDLLQLIKQIIVEHKDHDNFEKMVNRDIETSINIMYPKSNISQLFKVIKSELIDKVDLVDLDEEDFSMEAMDDFGKILNLVYSTVLKRSDKLGSSDLSTIKTWINKDKSSGKSINSRVRSRKVLKDKVFNNISSELEEEEESY